MTNNPIWHIHTYGFSCDHNVPSMVMYLCLHSI